MSLIMLPSALCKPFDGDEEALDAFVDALNQFFKAVEMDIEPAKAVKIPPALREFWGDPACDALLDLYRQHYESLKEKRQRERAEDNS